MSGTSSRAGRLRTDETLADREAGAHVKTWAARRETFAELRSEEKRGEEGTLAHQVPEGETTDETGGETGQDREAKREGMSGSDRDQEAAIADMNVEDQGLEAAVEKGSLLVGAGARDSTTTRRRGTTPLAPLPHDEAPHKALTTRCGHGSPKFSTRRRPPSRVSWRDVGELKSLLKQTPRLTR